MAERYTRTRQSFSETVQLEKCGYEQRLREAEESLAAKDRELADLALMLDAAVQDREQLERKTQVLARDLKVASLQHMQEES